MTTSVVRDAPDRLTAVLIAAATLHVVVGAWLGFRPFDDTFITFRYALNFANGHGFVYNDLERVLGTTTPLWTLVLAGLHVAQVPMASGALAVSLGVNVITGLLMVRLLTGLGFPRLVATTAALLFWASFDHLSITRSAMEVPLFSMWVFASLCALAASHVGWAGAAAGLAVLTRPEALVLVLVAAMTRPMRGAALIRGAVAFTLVVGLWAGFATWYFGSAIPQSILAKADSAAAADRILFNRLNVWLFVWLGQFGGAVFTRTLWALHAAWTLLAVTGATMLMRSAWRSFVLLAVFPSVVFTALALTHAFTWFPWYYGTFYPFLAMLAVIGASAVAQAIAPSPRIARLTVAAVATVLAASQVTAAVRVKLPADRDRLVESYRDVVRDIPRRAEIVVAAPEIGVVGWETWPARIIDLVGLVTPEAVDTPWAALIHDRRPDYLVLRTDNGAELLHALAAEAWFAVDYELWRTTRDPNQRREFRAYRRRDVPK